MNFLHKDSDLWIWRSMHVASWLAGALYFATPFNLFWKLGNGSLGYNVLITLGLSLIGIAVSVSCSRRIRKSVVTLDVPLRGRLAMMVCFLHLFALLGCLGALLLSWPSWVALASSLTTAFFMVFFLVSLPRSKISLRRRRSWHRRMVRRWHFNGAFWLCVFVLLATRDVYAVWSLEGLNHFEQFSAALGRTATQAVFTLGLMIMYHVICGLTPVYFRVAVTGLFSLLPCLIVADFLMREFWNQSLLAVVNFFTSTGAFDFDKEVAASGLSWTTGQVTLASALVLIACGAIFGISGKISRASGMRIANRGVFIILVACWLVVVTESALSHVTKRTESWRRHYKAFDAHLGLFAPPAGFEKLEVVFREPAPEDDRQRLLFEVKDTPHLRKPDIYVFMVESWRSDSVTPDVAPFLSRFCAEEAQELGRTFAGSNCTPLSWFSFLHSRLAIHWAEALNAGGEDHAGAYPLRILDKLGYEIHVRAVCDLGYKSLGALNFGAGNRLADFFVDDSERVEPMTIPQREKLLMNDLRHYLGSDPKDPQFHFVALDSPHYNYYWPSDFEALHPNCAGNIPTNLRPNKDVVDGVVRRYQNAVHWIDYAIEEFVDFLKLKGRYDNALIVLTGDHGEEFQEEGSWFHCSSLNRFQTEVPIIIKWPQWAGQLPAQNNVSHYDVMPSILELIGLEPRFYESLSGQSLLRYREHPREAVISTVHRGATGIGLCMVRGERKVKFSFPGPWSMRVPDKLYVSEYSDLMDQPVDFRPEIGDLTHVEYIREQFPVASGRFFDRLEKN